MSAVLSYIPYLDSTGTARKNGTVQQTVGGVAQEVPRYVADGAFQACYTIPISAAISTGTANSHLLEIMAGATYDVLVIEIMLRQFVAAGSATVGQVGWYRLSSAGTGGTAITPAKLDNGDASAGATAMTLASAKGTETTLLYSDAGVMLSTAPTSGARPFIDWKWDWTREKALRIPAGTSNGGALKLITPIASGTVLGWAKILEVSYS